MNLRSTAILAGAVLVIGTYLWFEEVPSKEPQSTRNLLGEPLFLPATQPPIQHFFEFSPRDIIEVRLQHEGETRTARRQDDHWMGTSNPGAIDDFLHSIATLGVVMNISAQPTNLHDYGLEPPRSVIALGLRSGAQPLVLQIGDRNPSTTGVYIRTGENGPLALAGALVAWEFEKAFRALGSNEQTP
jgi:hypothetical protein